jgi:hypothetical protein
MAPRSGDGAEGEKTGSVGGREVEIRWMRERRVQRSFVNGGNSAGIDEGLKAVVIVVARRERTDGRRCAMVVEGEKETKRARSVAKEGRVGEESMVGRILIRTMEICSGRLNNNRGRWERNDVPLPRLPFFPVLLPRGQAQVESYSCSPSHCRLDALAALPPAQQPTSTAPRPSQIRSKRLRYYPQSLSLLTERIAPICWRRLGGGDRAGVERKGREEVEQAEEGEVGRSGSVRKSRRRVA